MVCLVETRKNNTQPGHEAPLALNQSEPSQKERHEESLFFVALSFSEKMPKPVSRDGAYGADHDEYRSGHDGYRL